MSRESAVMILHLEPLVRRFLKLVALVSASLLVLPTLSSLGQSDTIRAVHDASASVGSLPAQALLALTTIVSVGGMVWMSKSANAALAQLATDVAVIRETLHNAGLHFEPKK